MDNSQTNKLSMYKTVRAFGTNEAVAFNAAPIISTTFSDLSGLINQVNTAAKKQATKTVGITRNKAQQKKQMAEWAIVVSRTLSAYATRTDNIELKNAMKYTVSEISQKTEAEAAHTCEIIYEKAMSLVAELADYGITTTNLANFRALINSFEELIGKRRGSVGTKVAATQDLDLLFVQADSLLKEVLDKLLLPFKTSNPNLYNQYLNARQIIDLGSRSKSEATPVKVEVK